VNRGIEPEVVEYLKEPPSKKELRELITKLGINAEELVRKNEAIFKEYYKGKELSEDDYLNAMVKYPKLIERPIVVKDKKAIIGRPPENVEELF
jgi:arsenate reductase